MSSISEPDRHRLAALGPAASAQPNHKSLAMQSGAPPPPPPVAPSALSAPHATSLTSDTNGTATTGTTTASDLTTSTVTQQIVTPPEEQADIDYLDDGDETPLPLKENGDRGFSIDFTDLKSNSDSLDVTQISVAIPSTGLKHNLPREGRSSTSDSTSASPVSRVSVIKREGTPSQSQRSLPAGAQGSNHPTARITADEQERARGRGPGRHEGALSPAIVDGQDAEGNSIAPEDEDNDNLVTTTPTQHHIFRSETGDAPQPLPALKVEEPPGSNRDIVLKPRVVDVQCRPNVDTPTEDIADNDIWVTPVYAASPPPLEYKDRHSKSQAPKSQPPDMRQHTAHNRHVQRPSLSLELKRKSHDKARPIHGEQLANGKGKGRALENHGETVENLDYPEEDANQQAEAMQFPRPPSRAQSLKDLGLGGLPPGESEAEWDDDTGDEEAFRSALQSGATTPLSHPADPKGDHGYWSTFRHEGVGRVGESSRARSPSRLRGSRPGSTKASRPGSISNAPLGTPARAHPEDRPSPKTGAMRHAIRFTTKMLQHRHPTAPSAPRSPEISAPIMTNEMLAGALPVMILKTWLDRDEDGHRAVPVLLGNLRFRIGDSVGIRAGGRHTGREMFKIECEYGDGAIKWVVYREIRDFLRLHAHYKTANIGTRVAGLRSSRRVEMPEFPWNSLPYWLREKGEKHEIIEEVKDTVKENVPISEKEKEKTAVGGIGPGTRMALQQYLIDLIRAVLFRPESNKLCQFFELSALTVALAPRGGFQGKAGFLKILSSKTSRRSNQPGILPSTWRQHRSPKWFIVRESYFVAADGPQDTDIYDVFLLDGDFNIERPKRAYRKGIHLLSGTGHKKKHVEGLNDMLEDDDSKNTSQHTFYITNAQRRIKLVARNARELHQFIVSMERVAMQCVWTGRNRFDSFAPVRLNVAAQWLVDGRDYFWNLSRAINMAKSSIYIHDWWISPEIYLRRPGDDRYRLDNLLKRKAEEGVRICIIIYNEVSAKTTPVESLYAKRKLMALHPNILVQRSPSHLPSGALYWSHHEKLCVIDEAIAFMGGLDLCFGRWDTSQHILTDEDHTAPNGPDGPVWQGKDYWNERVAEFHDLDKPYDDAFDRSKTPRMPWHDVGLQIVGQPARDLCRHFCQRWNYLLRIKNHSRRMPFLLPPPDFTERELVDLKLQGTCEVQICRSVGPWSMGTLTKVEHSIQNAYVKSIQLSEHFVYIENQFFITSTVVDTTPIENRVGDALVQRIIRAHKEGQKWKACIVIPLLPGYTHPIDKPEASSVRLILECQNRTICRGTHSIFSRLRREGINPDDYITFFSLRTWSKFRNGALTTEQVYIHGKTMIVDDRLVLCGSANINERSQRGDRDSELVAVVRDTDMIDGTMAGKPFKVGRYAHTLRMRLMREHVGVDVDAIEEDELMLRRPIADQTDIALWDPDNEQSESQRRGITRVKKTSAPERLNQTLSSAMGQLAKGIGKNVKREAVELKDKVTHPIQAMEGRPINPDPGPPTEELEDTNPDGTTVKGFASSVVPTLEEKTLYERRPDARHANGQPLFGLVNLDSEEMPPESRVPHQDQIQAEKLGDHSPERHKEKYGVPAAFHHEDGPPQRPSDELLADELEHGEDAYNARRLLRKHLSAKVAANPWNMPTPTPKIDPNRFHDPLDDRFWNDMWVAVAVHNTQIFRKVFRCIPDDLVTSWAQYKAFANHMDKFGRTQESKDENVKVTHDQGGSGGGTAGPAGSNSKLPQTADGHQETFNPAGDHVHNEGDNSACEPGAKVDSSHLQVPGQQGGSRSRSNTVTSQNGPERLSADATVGGNSEEGHKPSGENDAWAQWELDQMEELLNEVRGHLVLYSTRFLEAEDLANNFLFNQERILPLAIYD